MVGNELEKLIRKDLTFSEVMKVIRHQSRMEIDNSQNKTIRIAVVSSGSIQYFTKIFRSVMQAYGFSCEIFESDYDGIRMNILDPTSELYRFQPSYVIVMPYYTDIKEFPAISCDQGEYTSLLCKTVAYHERIFESLSAIHGVHVFWCNYVVPFLCETGSYECNTPNSKNSFLQEINRQIREIKPKFVTIIDLDAYAAYVGKKNWFDMTGYFCNKIPFGMDYIHPVVKQIGRLIKALTGGPKKCLVLDLDNTLWGGVAGDLGTHGVVLDPNDAEGEAYRFFQSYIKGLKERGVILAVCSKNDLAVAQAPFQENPYMILKMEDIACFVANWEDKASNIKHIADTLNIGIDSLVFFDDNPAEREIVRKFQPEVTVIEVPEDVDSYTTALDRSGCFDWVDITKEDVQRVQTYKANEERKKLENSAVDYDQYLQSLEMAGDVSEITEAEIERFTQLINKSNQFNLRTIRYTDKEIHDMAQDDRFVLLPVKLKDKFSVYGIIACVILRLEDRDCGKCCFVDTLVMSCRVLKRGVETMIMNKIKAVAESHHAEFICGEYRKTAKNSMVESFYDGFGFALTESDEQIKQYCIAAAEMKETPCYIEKQVL